MLFRSRGETEIDRLVERFDARIGLDRLVMIHYNDSKAAHGSKLDRHQHIGGGEVGTRGLAALIRHPRLAHVNYYLETPGMEEGWDRLNVERSLLLADGQLKLKPLPAAERAAAPKRVPKRVTKRAAKSTTKGAAKRRG